MENQKSLSVKFIDKILVMLTTSNFINIDIDNDLSESDIMQIGLLFKAAGYNVTISYYKADCTPNWITIDKINKAKNYETRYWKGVAL